MDTQIKPTVKHIEQMVHYVDCPSTGTYYLLPSGDGYSPTLLMSQLKIIAKDADVDIESLSIYAGIEYEYVPFDSLYNIWNSLEGNSYKIPTKGEFNAYDHGFFQVLV